MGIGQWLERRRRRREETEFAPAVEAARLSGPHVVSSLLLITIVLFFAAALLWARVAILDEATHGEGRIIPSSDVQVIQHLEGGILKSMHVSEGEVVEKGQVLLQVDNTSSASRYGELKATYYTLLGQIARLTAEAEQAPLAFPQELLTEAREVALNERQLYDARQAELQTQLAILRDQSEQRGRDLHEQEGKLKQLGERLGYAQEELRITEPLVRERIVPKVNFLKLKREISGIEGEMDATRAAVERTRSLIKEAQQRLAERTLTFVTTAVNELNAKKSELSGVEQTLTAQKDRVQRTDIRSPVKGIIKELKIRTVGGVIKPGEDLVEVVPLEDTLLVEARIRPADIAFLRPGQPSMVKVSAYDFTVYGGLRGKLERISADTIVDERGEAYYKVIIRTDRNTLDFNGKELPIMPGMIVTADVLTGRKSVLDYLLKPILRAKELALRER